jgi:hypothetical protein
MVFVKINKLNPKAGQDRYDPNSSVATVSGYVDIPRGDEQALLSAVAKIGPISVGIDASHRLVQSYIDCSICLEIKHLLFFISTH